MKTFIINLATDIKKREKITEQCNKASINYEIIDAVNGKRLQSDIIPTLAFNYPKCKLTHGEIGCAISHLKIYAKIVAEKIPYALVLEDDSVITESPRELLVSIGKIINQSSPEIFLLSTPESYNPLITRKIKKNIVFHRMSRASQASAYVINFEAANKILHFNLPIKYEADRWMVFRDFCDIKIWCMTSGIINSYDSDKSDSNIEHDRKIFENERQSYLNKIRKLEAGYQKRRLINLIIDKFSHKCI